MEKKDKKILSNYFFFRLDSFITDNNLSERRISDQARICPSTINSAKIRSNMPNEATVIAILGALHLGFDEFYGKEFMVAMKGGKAEEFLEEWDMKRKK